MPGRGYATRMTHHNTKGPPRWRAFLFSYSEGVITSSKP